MAKATTILADQREDFGKNAARRLRRAGRIPGVVYGGGGSSIPVTVDPKEVSQILYSESGHNTLFAVEIKGKTPARVMLRDWQVEPIKGHLLHVDMVRIATDVLLKVRVPIHLTGEAQGVKLQGGILDFVLREVEVECLPDDIPERVSLDISDLNLGHNLRVSDVPIGPKVKLVTDPNRVVAHVEAPKAEEEKPVVEVAEAAPAEPEVIRKGKAEEEGEEGGEKSEKTEKAEKKEAKKEGKRE